MDESSIGPIISVFGSSRPLKESEGYENARLLGVMLATAGFAVATGGYEGTMAAVSEGAASAGGYIIGVTSERIEGYRGARPNKWLEKEIRYKTLVDRQMHLVTRNKGIVVLPGGIGTLAEFALAWSLIQVNEIPPRPIILMSSIWRNMIDRFVQDGYVKASHLSSLKYAETPAEVLVHLRHEVLT